MFMLAKVTKIVVGVVVLLLVAAPAPAEDWTNVQFVEHKVYQAVNDAGGSTYSGGWPMRIRGVILNNTEDWLDPTPAYDSGVHLWQMGGEAELYVQAVNLDGTAWDPDPGTAYDDFGGTACWMGQNYGNHAARQDPIYNYTNAEWTVELNRLNLYGGDGVANPFRAGDLVEVRVRGGLNYKGKMNVNEQHDNDYDRYDNWDNLGTAGDGQNHDFEIVPLQSGYGLPTPAAITLSEIKDANDDYIFDSARATGGEHYQSTLVEIRNVKFTDDTIAHWGSDSDLILEDARGLTLGIHLGLNDSFDSTSAPTGYFDVIGILDQSDWSGKGGYQLLVMNAGDVPEPTVMVLLGMGALAVIGRRRDKIA